ncbi:MAG: hypothetical protein LUG12_04890 [Erysipelotrichaceae bacterium]|nr:hypothetical protein [Erysipelotrichaceae bacterium]
MKVIFLDIDGVLQPYDSKNRFETNLEMLSKYLSIRYQRDYTIYDRYDVGACFLDWDKNAVKRIKTILDATNARIVISSAWRSGAWDYQKPYKMLDLLYLWNLEKYWNGETDSELGYREMFYYKYRDTHNESYYEIYKNFDESKMMIRAKQFIETHGCKRYDREMEIIDYLFKHEDITNYVVIDDMYMFDVFDGHFVRTRNVIKDDEMYECIRILNSTINLHHELNAARGIVI